MKIDFHQDATGLRAAFSGSSGFGDYRQVEQFCQMIEQGGTQFKTVQIDLSGLEFIDSSGLGLLLLLKEQCDRYSVRVQIANPCGQVRKMLEASRLNELFGIPYQDRH